MTKSYDIDHNVVSMGPGDVVVRVNDVAYRFDTGDGPHSYPSISGVPRAVVVTLLRTLADEIENGEADA